MTEEFVVRVIPIIVAIVLIMIDGLVLLWVIRQKLSKSQKVAVAACVAAGFGLGTWLALFYSYTVSETERWVGYPYPWVIFVSGTDFIGAPWRSLLSTLSLASIGFWAIPSALAIDKWRNKGTHQG